MSGFLSRLRGFLGPSQGTEETAEPSAGEPEAYKEFLIQPEPIAEGGQFRLAGRILSGTGEGRKEHHFIRADVFASRAEAEQAAIRKGQRLVDEQGARLFGE